MGAQGTPLLRKSSSAPLQVTQGRFQVCPLHESSCVWRPDVPEAEPPLCRPRSRGGSAPLPVVRASPQREDPGLEESAS